MAAAVAPDRSRRASKDAPSARFAVAGASARRSAASLYACQQTAPLIMRHSQCLRRQMYAAQLCHRRLAPHMLRLLL